MLIKITIVSMARNNTLLNKAILLYVCMCKYLYLTNRKLLERLYCDRNMSDQHAVSIVLCLCKVSIKLTAWFWSKKDNAVNSVVFS